MSFRMNSEILIREIRVNPIFFLKRHNSFIMKKIILYISITLAAGLLLTNIYTSIVDARIWGAEFPKSIQAARSYYHYISPGAFFGLFSPANLLFGLLSVIFYWNSQGKVRTFLIIALLLYAVNEAFTFAYFYPRNMIMFGSNIKENLEDIKTAWEQWNQMNWIRSIILLTGLIFSFKGLDVYYKIPDQSK